MTGERQTVGCRAMKLVRDLVGELVVLGPSSVRKVKRVCHCQRQESVPVTTMITSSRTAATVDVWRRCHAHLVWVDRVPFGQSLQ